MAGAGVAWQSLLAAGRGCLGVGRAVEQVAVGVVPAGVGRYPTAAQIRELEDLGVDSLWAPGHIASGRAVPEAITGACRLATLSERATVGTAVLLAPLYHPVIVAKQFAELDRMTDGRMVLGVGVGGEYPSEFGACQVPVTERGPRTDEHIDVVRQLFSGRQVDNFGRFWPFEAVSIAPAPVRAGGPPIIVAGRKAPAMRRAATRGDGWMPFLYTPEQYRSSVETIRTVARAAGRDLAAFQWMCFVYVSIHDDEDTARTAAVRFIGAGQAGDGSRFERIVDRIAAAGRPEQVAARLRQFLDAGARHLVVVVCSADESQEGARRLLTEVMPEVRSTHAHQ